MVVWASSRDAASPDDFRTAWDAIETLWEATLDRARLLPGSKLHEQVDGEWSLVETQEYVVRRCLKVVLKEEAEHHRYAVRDLAGLDAGVWSG